jgi:hypothetical protein
VRDEPRITVNTCGQSLETRAHIYVNRDLNWEGERVFTVQNAQWQHNLALSTARYQVL